MANNETEISLDEIIDMFKQSSVMDPDLVTFYRMKKERKIWFDLCVGENALAYVRLIMLWNMEDRGIAPEDRKPIWIYLENYGGDADMMWMMIDVIEHSETPIYTVNMGIAGSAASMIFVAGKKRYMMPNANVVIHEGSATVTGDAVKVIDNTENYKKSLKKSRDFILEHTEIPTATMNKKKNNDWYLDAEYCLDHGVCDCVVSSLDQII